MSNRNIITSEKRGSNIGENLQEIVDILVENIKENVRLLLKQIPLY